MVDLNTDAVEEKEKCTHREMVALLHIHRQLSQPDQNVFFDHFHENHDLYKNILARVERFAVLHECPICYDKLPRDDIHRVACFACCRSVCKKCMQNWSATTDKRRCVICRDVML